MKLSAATYHRIMSALRSDGPDKLGREKRGEPRAGVSGRAEVFLPGAAQRRPRSLPVRDLSRTGIGLLSPVPAEPGEQFVVVLPADANGPARSLLFRVAHCRQINRELFGIGGELVSLTAGTGTVGVMPPSGAGEAGRRGRNV